MTGVSRSSARPRARLAGFAGGLLFALLALSACGGSGGSSAAVTATPTETLAPLPSSTAVRPSPTPTRTPPPTPSPSPSPTPTPKGDQVQAAIGAATLELSARYLAPLTRDACLQNNPERRVCIAIDSAPGAVALGIARFSAGDPDGGGFTVVFGRGPDAAWHYWFGTQQRSYRLLDLPGAIRVCGGGQGASVLAQPDAASAEVAKLADGAQLQSDAFVLTTPGVYGAQGNTGEGFYHVTSPAGWIDARSTSDASLGDCALHDAIERPTRG